MMSAVGATMLFLSTFQLIIMLATDSIPAKWPFKPPHRDDCPTAYRMHFFGFASAWAGGALLLILSFFELRVHIKNKLLHHTPADVS